MRKLTHARLVELLHYDPATGVFTRRIATGYRGCHKAGSVCGSLDKSTGYIRIGIDGEEHWAHRLAWFYVHRAWPEADIDHLDRTRANNAIANLRTATRAQNLHNQVDASPRSQSGIRGVVWEPTRKRWKVSISVGNKNRHVGRFEDIDAARAAYLVAKRAQAGEGASCC